MTYARNIRGDVREHDDDDDPLLKNIMMMLKTLRGSKTQEIFWIFREVHILKP